MYYIKLNFFKTNYAFSTLTFVIVFFSFSNQTFSQTSDYVFYNYNVKDGLLSNECHDLLEDSRGYIWISTDNGVCRFDGYKFHIYGPKEGLLDPVIFEMQEDIDGRIWMVGLQAEFYIYDPTLDRFEEYEWNNRLDFSKFSSFIDEFRVKNGSLVFSYNRSGLHKIDSHGNQQIKFNDTFGEYKYITEEIDFTFLAAPPIESSKLFGLDSDNWTINFINEEEKKIKSLSIPKNMIGLRKSRAIIADQDTFLISDKFKYHKNKFNIESKLIGEIISVEKSKEGEILCYTDKKKVILVQSFKKENFKVLIEDIVPTNCIKAKDGSYWISTLDQGIYIIPNSKITFLTSSFQNEIFSNIELNKKSIYASINTNHIVEYNLDEKTTDIHPLPLGIEVYDIETCPVDQSLFISGRVGIYQLLDGQFKKISSHYKGLPLSLTTKKLNFYNEFLWGHSGSMRYIYNFAKEETILLENYSDGIPFYENVRFNDSYIINDSSAYYTTLDGIRLASNLNNEQFEFNTFLSNPLDYENLPTTRFDQIVGNMKVKFLSSKGNGLLVWHSIIEQISRKPKTFYINSSHGLSSNNIEDIYLDKDENLWVASLKGLDKITFKEDLSFQIRNYNTTHGLPSNDIYEIQMNDSLIFLSTGSGLVQFQEPEFNPISKKPVIISAKLDNVTFDEYKEFNPSNNHLELEFITLNYKMPGQIHYRYRANKQEWVRTDQTNIQLLDLRPNDYLLEIQSQNEDGVWSESTTVDFHICFPWYQQWYFNLFLAFIGLSIGYLFYKSRINRLKEQNQTSQEIRELEKSALQAQMNPHFIFNCLNSIQNFIMDNEQELAMEYLGNFANLIRQNLNASVDAKITLDEEVAMLENYLKLEQLRFSNKFDYSISIHENLDILDIKIAPLLIQPFVENAVLHGMSNIKSDGQINIHFSTVKDKLLVKISDNGGYRTQKQKKKHKSFGMSITQKRLAFINEIDNNKISIITNINAKGTEVDVLIKV